MKQTKRFPCSAGGEKSVSLDLISPTRPPLIKNCKSRSWLFPTRRREHILRNTTSWLFLRCGLVSTFYRLESPCEPAVESVFLLFTRAPSIATPPREFTQNLCAELVYDKPENPRAYLMQKLSAMQVLGRPVMSLKLTRRLCALNSVPVSHLWRPLSARCRARHQPPQQHCSTMPSSIPCLACLIAFSAVPLVNNSCAQVCGVCVCA